MNGTREPPVTVVTPVHNGAKFLQACIESVIAQSYRNWKYVIVDNCSTDASLEIARRFEGLDSRIRVFAYTEFLPVAESNSRAISLIGPDCEYCKPLMADDWLYPDCISKMVRCALEQPSIGLVCSYASTGSELLFTGLRDACGVQSFMSGRQACRMSLLGDAYFFGSPTTMLLRADLIRKRVPFYNPLNLHADEQASYDILQESDFGFVHEPLAFFRKHEGSETSRAREFESIFVGRVYSLARYGRVYLTDAEFERRFGQRMGEYYALLAGSVVGMRPLRFWKYHVSKMREIGAPLNWARLLAVLALRGARACASTLPGQLLLALVGRGRFSRNRVH